jgi:restriction system protein
VAEIPDYQTLMLPLLRIAALGESSIPKAVEKLGVEFGLTSDQLAEMLPSGGTQLINNRAHWAKTYLAKAGLLDQPRRGVFRITQRGTELLKQNPSRIDNHTLAKYPEFRAFVSQRLATGEELSKATATKDLPAGNAAAPPNERIVAAAKELDAGLRDDLLNRIFQIEPMSSRARFFERLVIRLLLAMDYGKGRDDAAFHTGGRGDGGIDGVIHEDALGIDPVYVQAKCYDRGTVIGPEKIQAFKGALDDKGATRGVFITTAKFSEAALRSGRASQKQIALIDGERLADLMVRFNVGAQVQQTIFIKKLDEDFFED